VRVAVAGLGSAALQGHLPALARLEQEHAVTLVAVADPDARRHALIALERPNVPAFTTAEAMLTSTASDLLVIATDPSAHARLAILGAKHRQHVICEKPLSVTRSDHELITREYTGSGLALLSVHQYRYSSTWLSLARLARLATRLRVPYDVIVHVEREGTDPRAVSGWRKDLELSGGVLADHGTHFLALGYTLSDDLEVLCVSRTGVEVRGEGVCAKLRLASRALTLNLSTEAMRRHTGVELRSGVLALRWHDDRLFLVVGKRVARRWNADALSDRAQINTLYEPLYRELVANFRDPSWCVGRTTEALTIGNLLIELLERAAS
jgi:predicted dehydrogenase